MCAGPYGPPELVGHRVGLAREPGVRDPDDAISRQRELRVAGAVALEGAPGVVRRGAIELYHEPSVAPQEVHLVALDVHVHLGLGEAMRLAHGEEHLLELGPGPGAPGLVPGEHLRQDPGAAAPRDGTQPCAGVAQVLGLVDGALEAAAGEHVGEVDEVAAGGGDGDGVDDGALAGWEAAPMDLETG